MTDDSDLTEAYKATWQPIFRGEAAGLWPQAESGWSSISKNWPVDCEGEVYLANPADAAENLNREPRT